LVRNFGARRGDWKDKKSTTALAQRAGVLHTVIASNQLIGGGRHKKSSLTSPSKSVRSGLILVLAIGAHKSFLPRRQYRATNKANHIATDCKKYGEHGRDQVSPKQFYKTVARPYLCGKITLAINNVRDPGKRDAAYTNATPCFAGSAPFLGGTPSKAWAHRRKV